MNFSFETQGANTYLVYQISETDEIDSPGLNMMTSNHIKGLFPVHFTQMNRDRYLKYNITAKMPISKFFEGVITKKQILEVFSGVADAVILAEKYMLNSSMFIFDPEHIFVDVKNYEVSMVCFPVVVSNREIIDVADFFKNIVFTSKYSQSENSDYIAKMISYLNSTANFSIRDFRDIIKQLSETNAANNEIAVNNRKIPKNKPEPSAAARERNTKPKQQTPPADKMKSTQPQLFTIPESMPSGEKSEKLQYFMSGNVSESPPMTPINTGKIPTDPAEKKISLFHLLMHYDKETKDAYMAQKQGKISELKSGINPSKKGLVKSSFAIPGEEKAMPQTLPSPTQAMPKISNNSPKPQRANKKNNAGPLNSIKNKELDFGDTNYCFEDTEDSGTVLMDQEQSSQQIMPHLVRKKNNERISINKDIYRLGRDRDFNDYVIAENKFVGHSHCHIITRDGECFIADDNSRNHTYVDGQMVSGGHEVKISHGQLIKVADEEFEFRLF